MADRRGVEIDHCPKCFGVWLDRGELDKIIDSLATTYGAHPAPQPMERRDRREEYSDRRRRKENPVTDLLGDLFDFQAGRDRAEASVAMFRVDPRQVAAPFAVILIQKLIGRCLPALNSFL